MLLGKITWIHYQLISLGANYPMTVHSCTGLQICIVPTKADKKHQSIKVITCGMTIAKFRIPIARPAGLNRKKKVKKCNHDDNTYSKWKYLGQGPDFQHD